MADRQVRRQPPPRSWLVFQPGRGFAERSALHSPRRGWPQVLLCGAAIGALQVAAAFVEPYGAVDASNQHRAAVAFGLLVAPVLLAFWVLDAAVIDAVAGAMGATSRRSRYRRTVAAAYPVLVGFGVVTLLRGGIDRLQGGIGPGDVAGLLDLPLLVWFIVLAAIAAREVYAMPGINALAAALLPYALLSGLTMLLVVVLSVLH